MSIRYIGQKLAQQIDEELMSSAGAFSLDQVRAESSCSTDRGKLTLQLMELAGLSCAQALGKSYPPKTHKKVLVCCGPGNQVSPAFDCFACTSFRTLPSHMMLRRRRNS